MAGEPLITITGGRVGKDPELKFLKDGTAVLSISVAVTPRKKDGDKWVDDNTIWFRVSQFGKDAESTTELVKKGDKVIVTGRFSMSEYINKEEQKVQSPEIKADGIAIMGRVTAKPQQPTQPVETPW
jgi:single-strand DNA-binding protein